MGLSATVTRKDGHHPIIFMQCGPVRHRVNAQRAGGRPSVRAHRPGAADGVPARGGHLTRTGASSSRRSIRSWSPTTRAIGASATTSSRPCASGRSPLVLTERNEHLDRLEQRLAPEASGTWSCCARDWARSSGRPSPSDWPTIPTRRGPGPAGDRPVHRRGIRRCAAGHAVPDAARLVARHHRAVRGPTASSARRQARGARLRLRRPQRADAGADVRPAVPRLRGRRLHDRSCPASAIPGWPRTSPLPSIRSGSATTRAASAGWFAMASTAPLASLFVHAARPVSADAEGVATGRRSATEAFLFGGWRRFPRPEGRFALNAELPIPFDGVGHAGGRPAVRRRARRRRTGRRSASGGSGRLPPRPAQGPAAAGERLLRAAVPRRGRRQGPRRRARCDPPGIESSTNLIAMGRLSRVLPRPVSGQWRAMPDGIDGIHGNGGNVVSVTYRFQRSWKSPNPTLSAKSTL